MQHIGYSELSKRYYFNFEEGKIDITDDIKEIIDFESPKKYAAHNSEYAVVAYPIGEKTGWHFTLLDICTGIESAKEIADKTAIEDSCIVSVYRKQLATNRIDEVYTAGVPEPSKDSIY